MKGYTYIEKDRVVVNTEKKPIAPPSVLSSGSAMEYYRDFEEHKQDLSVWNDSCIEVENVKKIEYRTHTVWYYTHDKGMTEIIFGELYECKKFNDKIILIDYA